jgi:hypothetical protein
MNAKKLIDYQVVCIFVIRNQVQKSITYKQNNAIPSRIPAARHLIHDFAIRDRPFNLQGGLWFFASFRNLFSDNTRVRIFIFFVVQSTNFFPEFNIRLYDKNSESDYCFFPPPKSELFFQQHWGSEYFFNATFNSISNISRRSVLLLENIGVL